MASLPIPHSFSNNTVASATEVNQNFLSIKSFAESAVVQVDGSVQAPTIAIADAAVTSPKLAPPTLVTKSSSTALVSTDANCTLLCGSASTMILTVPTSAVAFANGTIVSVVNYGSAQVTIQGDTGVNIRHSNGLKLRTQYSAASLIKISNTEWLLTGDTVA